MGRGINCLSNSHSLSDPSLKAAYNASKLAMKNLILMNGSCYELISQITLHSSRLITSNAIDAERTKDGNFIINRKISSI